MKKFLSVVALLSLGLLFAGLAGCGTIDRILKESGRESISNFFGSNTLQIADNTQTSSQSTTAIASQSVRIELFFLDGTNKTLISQERQIPKTLSIARETLNELIKGPEATSGMKSAIPTGTVLLDINVKENTAYVDLSREIQKGITGLSSDLTVKAIVSTLTQFPSIKQVKFKVEGKDVPKIGSTDISQPLSQLTPATKPHPILGTI